MSRRLARRAILPIAVLAGLCAPAAAHAYTVTVHVHGAGAVVETTAAKLMNCTTPSAVSGSTVTDCTAGSASGPYSWGWTVDLQAQVPQTLYDRGWRFLKWVDSTAGGGQIDCDPGGTGGDVTTLDCKFAIYENLQTNLYFTDVQAPTGTIASPAPASPTNATTASFTFNSNDPDATYQCRLDRPGAPGSFVTCGGPASKSVSYSGLRTNGSYMFSVRPVDPSGNVGLAVTRTWTVDTVPPAVTISGSPADGALTNSTATSFTVSANENATFSCTLDDVGTACGTPKAGLGDGTHTFGAFAADAAGNVGATSRTWTVDTTPPDTQMLDAPADGSTTPQQTATFAFASPESTASYECRLDGAAFAACTSPKTLTGLATGDHVFEVRAKDAAGNADPTPARRGWRVNALDKDADGFNSPQDCDDADPGVHPGATDIAGDGIDQDCSGADAPLPVVRVSLSASWKAGRSTTQVRKLLLAGMRRGTTVTVTCKGKGCAMRSKTAKASSKGIVDVGTLFRRRPLRAGCTLTIRVAAAGHRPKVFTFVIRKGSAPKRSTRS